MSNQTSSDVEERRESIAGAASGGPEGVTPPDRKRFQRELDEINERIRDLEAKLKKSLEKQNLSHSGANSKANVIVDREKLLRERQELRAQREKIIEERKRIDLDLKGLHDQVQRKDDACTKLKAGLRYKTETGIDEAVKRLERQVQVQQLRLQEEKRLVAEINKLKRSKRSLSDYLAQKEVVDQLRSTQTTLRAKRDDCVKQLNRLKSREEKVKNLLESCDDSAVEEAESKQAEVLRKMEDINRELTEFRAKKKNLGDNFSMEKSKYHIAVKEMKAQKQKEELARRKNERLVSRKEVEINRSKHQPFEKEKALCDTLIVHFEKHLFQAPDVSTSTAADKELSLSQRADAEFSGSDNEGAFLPRKSTTDDLFDVFGGNSKIHRKGSRKGRRSSLKEGPRKLNLQLEVVENILALDLTPPSSASDIPKILEKLREKKNLYESAATSKDLVTHSANDPMTPITEEAAPEFPSSLIGNAVSGNPGDIAEGDDALATTKDLPVNSNEAHLKKCNAPGDNSLPNSAEIDKGSFPEEDVGCADLKLRENLLLEEHGTADTTSTVALQVDETTLKREGVESDTHSAIHQKDELKFEEGSGEGVESEDLFRPLEGAASNAEQNNDVSSKEGGSDAKKDEGIPDEDDVCQTGGEMYSKQSSCNYASEIHLASSPHNNRLVEHNAAFERNSLNEGGAMVKMLGLGEEKCPA